MRKVAVITGGSRGIGLAIVKQMLNDGYQVATISRNLDNAEHEFKTLVDKENEHLFFMSKDVGNREDRESFINAVMEKFGRIDVLVNNAGVAPKVRKDLLEVSEESWDYVLNINLKGTMFISQLVANIMRKQEEVDGRRGMIIFMGSLSSYASSTNRVEYCASKAAVSMLTKVYADRLASDKIYVYEIRPGVIKTSMTKPVVEKYNKMIADGQFPIARWGYPEDLAMAVSCLCDGKLLYSTGQIINVDGGFHIRKL